MDFGFFAVLACLLIACSQTCFSVHQEVCIVSDGGSTKPSSRKMSTMNRFCQGGISDNAIITVLSGTHTMNTTCEVKNVKNVTLSGQQLGAKSVVRCTSSNSGFRFLNVSTLKISNIKFVGCGARWHLQTQYLDSDIPTEPFSALLFVNGSDLTLMNITVAKAQATAIYVYNVAGNVTMDSCCISHASSNDVAVAGGNYIVYDTFATKDTNLRISNSHVLNSGSHVDTHHHGAHKNKYSSGLVLFLGSSNVIAGIFNTEFSENRGTDRGGNMALIFYAFAPVTISHTTFNRGYSVHGAGLYVSFENTYFDLNKDKTLSPVISPNVLSIAHSTFTNNRGEDSGGGIYIRWKQSLLMNGSTHINVTNSRFVGNSVGVNKGLALYAISDKSVTDDPNSFSKLHVSLNLSNCTFSNHIMSLSNENSWTSNSVIAAVTIPYLALDGVTVNSNNCTAMSAIGSKVVFSGSTVISNNTAVTGAGFQLANTFLFLTPNTDLIIANNSAWQTGGGIQVYTYPSCLSLENNRMCFYQYTSDDQSLSRTVNFTISKNRASLGGDNVYSTGDYCQYFGSEQINIPPNTLRQPSSVSSDPQQICIGIPQKSGCTLHKNVTLYPGESITFLLHVVGRSLGSVSGTVTAGTKGGAAIEEVEKLQTVDISGRNITYTVYSPSSLHMSRSYLILEPLKYSCSESYNFPAKTKIEIFFSDCPFGFNITKKTAIKGFECQCDYSNPDISNCSIESRTITKRKHSWLGMIQRSNRSYLASTAYCPFDYCNSSFQHIKSRPDGLDQDEQCKYNRRGVLCGACQEGLSLVLGSSECRECSNAWLLLIVPFALAGLLLVAIIHLLNITVTMGTVCGLIFYANVMQDYSIEILSKDPVPALTPILQVFLSWLNLDLGITACFYDGMEAFGRTMLLFAFPIYIWVLSAVIVILSNRYIIFTRLVGENAVKVLSTLILLSYSKMLRITIGALKLKLVRVHSASISEMRWVADGNILYFDRQRHLALFVIAVVVVMLLLPFAMSLLCIRHVYSLSNRCKLFSFFDKLKPFFDTYTGPFKDSAKFWTGLLLFVRLLLLIVNSLDYKDNVIPYYAIIAACLILSTIMVFSRGVYEKRCLNIAEYFFILNICFVFLINTYKGGPDSWKSTSSHLLVSCSLLAFLGIVAYHIYLKLTHTRLSRPQSIGIDYDRLDGEGMQSVDYDRRGLD